MDDGKRPHTPMALVVERHVDAKAAKRCPAYMSGLMPITLRFSRLVGDILREVPESQIPQPKYKYYM